MNVAVTGGTGFIGSAMCKRLLADGYAVTVLTRDRRRAQQQVKGQIRLIESPKELDGESTPEIIVNLAGLSLGSGRWTRDLKQTFISSRVGVTRQLIDYMAHVRTPPRLLISGSAVGYYGARGDEVLTEDSSPGQEYQADLCKAWETEASKAINYGVRVCLLRSGVVFGKGGGALSSLVPQFKSGLGGHVGTGKQWMSWIHIDDLIAIVLYLMANESLQGPFNTTTPNPVTNRDFASRLSAALRRPAFMWAPGWVMRLLIGEMAHLYITGQKVIPKRLLESGYKFRYPELSLALAEILA
ncbi:MAG: TIGR01777 family oxidoreductase [Gammaproteobacteria bacterium]|nr:TIGR01777 family oxidoreductase [Gammaproteobacteria bacterium]